MSHTLFHKQDKSSLWSWKECSFHISYFSQRDGNLSSIKIWEPGVVAFAPLQPSVILCKWEAQQPVFTSFALLSSSFLHPLPTSSLTWWDYESNLSSLWHPPTTFPDLALMFHFLSSLQVSLLSSFPAPRSPGSLLYDTHTHITHFAHITLAFFFFGHLGRGRKTTDISMPFQLIWTCWQSVVYLHIQQIRSNIIIHLELCLWPPGECKSSIHSHLAPFLVSTNSWGKYLGL